MSEFDYIAATARSVSERLERDLAAATTLDSRQLAEDVAWIARQLARLAESCAASVEDG